MREVGKLRGSASIDERVGREVLGWAGMERDWQGREEGETRGEAVGLEPRRPRSEGC
jgi:hypothetical protein